MVRPLDSTNNILSTTFLHYFFRMHTYNYWTTHGISYIDYWMQLLVPWIYNTYRPPVMKYREGKIDGRDADMPRGGRPPSVAPCCHHSHNSIRWLKLGGLKPAAAGVRWPRRKHVLPCSRLCGAS